MFDCTLSSYYPIRRGFPASGVNVNVLYFAAYHPTIARPYRPLSFVRAVSCWAERNPKSAKAQSTLEYSLRLISSSRCCGNSSAPLLPWIEGVGFCHDAFARMPIGHTLLKNTSFAVLLTGINGMPHYFLILRLPFFGFIGQPEQKCYLTSGNARSTSSKRSKSATKVDRSHLLFGISAPVETGLPILASWLDTLCQTQRHWRLKWFNIMIIIKTIAPK